MSFTISQAAALATRENRAQQASIDWSSPEVRQNGVDLLRELVAKVRSGELRYIGQGSQGPETAAFQYALMAASGGAQSITIDGIFGSRTSHQSTDLLASVQKAVGERSTKYHGTGPEAAGINTFVAIHNRIAAADASPLQLGMAPPAVAAGQRTHDRAQRLTQYDALVAGAPAAAPLAEPNPERFGPAPVPAPPAAAAAPITDEASARAAITAVADPANAQRAEALQRLGIAARAPAAGVDNAAVVKGAVAGLTEGEPDATNHRIIDFLVANAGQDNSAVLTGLGATPQWAALRAYAASPGFDATGVAADTLNTIAGPRPAANAPEPAQQTWSMIRLLGVNARLEARQPLSRDDMYIVARMANDDGLKYLANGNPADAVAAVRQRIDELQPAQAAQLLAAIHGPASAEPNAPVDAAIQKRRAIAYGVAHDVFDKDGVGDNQRYAFFSALAAAGNPTLVTMPPAEYGPMMQRIYNSSTGNLFSRGDRYIGDLRPALEERRRAIYPEAPRTRWSIPGDGYFPLG